MPNLTVNIEHMKVETLVSIANDLSIQIDGLEMIDNETGPLIMPPLFADFRRVCDAIERNWGQEYMMDNVRAVQNW